MLYRCTLKVASTLKSYYYFSTSFPVYLLFNATEYVSGPWFSLHLKVKWSTGSCPPCHTSKVHRGYLIKAYMHRGLMDEYEASFQWKQHSTSSFVWTGYTTVSCMARNTKGKTFNNQIIIILVLPISALSWKLTLFKSQ